ncbi:MAG: metal-dependent hydrolase [Candidatus Andersenbacteria bacterium]
MMGRTHTAAGLLLVVTYCAFTALPFSGLVLLMAWLGSLAPDLDARDATIRHLSLRWGPGKRNRLPLIPLEILGDLFHYFFGHRGVLHSLLAVILILIGGLFINVINGISGAWLLAFTLGYTSHLLLDALTPSGIPLWYPHQTTVSFLPRGLRIPTRSLGDIILFASCSLLLLSWFYFYPALINQLLGN